MASHHAVVKSVIGSCVRKAPFHSRRAAKDAATRMRRFGGVRLEPYRCKHCGAFHLTSWV
jgi:hypothetical protein